MIGRIACITAVLVASMPAQAAWQTARWDFDVFLDGRRIGEHTFTVEQSGDQRFVTSVATFDVKVLLVPVFQYRHEAREHWQGTCLTALQSSTRVNGKDYDVVGMQEGESFQINVAVDGDTKQHSLPGCVSTYAYWDLDTLSAHTHLLNGQTGTYDPIELQQLPARVELRGPSFAIDLDYRGGQWQGLSTLRDGRALEYRPRNATLAMAR